MPLQKLVFRLLPAIALSGALAACMPPAAQTRPDEPALDQRVRDLERRIERLEARPEIQPPLRSRAELEAEVRSLQEARAALLGRYTEQHPEIRDIDRRLTILERQLQMLDAPR